MAKTVKISEENYFWLLKIASELQKKVNCSVTINDSLNEIKKMNSYSRNLSSLAGSWKVSEKESNYIGKGLKDGWKKWKIKSV